MALVQNKKVHFNYELLDGFEAGLELFGYEVRSLRAGHGSLKGARVVARGGEAYLVGATIPDWQPANAPKSYDPERSRRLLLTAKEIDHIRGAESEKGLTVVPLSVYNKGSLLKVDIAIVRGKKRFDKRETTKKRETDRETRREFSDK